MLLAVDPLLPVPADVWFAEPALSDPGLDRPSLVTIRVTSSTRQMISTASSTFTPLFIGNHILS
jgi:hypothetical protein